MAKYRKITDSARIVTDSEVLKHLERGGIDKHYVALFEGYTQVHPTAKLYRDGVSRQMITCCSGLPKVTPQGAPIIPRWHRTRKGVYLADENLFTAETTSSKSHVVVGTREALWKPAVYLNGKKQSCGKPTLLETDPSNGNCRHNVLEWDYGLCKRRLRLIEGTILELWIFDEDPGGNVVIKSNTRGDLPARKYFAVDARRKPLAGFKVVEDEKRVPVESWQKAAYPVVIDDTYTGYSTTSDGFIYRWFEETYAGARDAETGTLGAGGEDLELGQQQTSPGELFEVNRAFFFFDTSEIQGTISAATLSLYGEINVSIQDFDMVVQIGSGTPPTYPHDPLEVGDFDKDHYSGDGGSLSTSGFLLAYNNITLNETGRGWINKSGTTKLCVRSSRDIAGNEPVADNEESVWIWTAEKGTGYKPKLVATYTPPASPRHGFVSFQDPGIL